MTSYFQDGGHDVILRRKVLALYRLTLTIRWKNLDIRGQGSCWMSSTCPRNILGIS